MIVYPAIDLMDGRAVRLRQGDPTRRTTVGDDPVEVARRWAAEGAAWLHVVDLDGALGGRMRHLALIERICGAIAIPVQVGGGLRSPQDLRAALAAGAARAVVATAALEGGRLADMVDAIGDRLAVALDARGGQVAVEGWQRTTGLGVAEAASRLAQAGVGRLIYTDAARDGMLGGPDLEGLAAVIAVAGVPVIASGGIRTLDDLRAAEAVGAEGVIVGRALYDGALTLRDALAALGRTGEC